jgi:hypothetical protein
MPIPRRPKPASKKKAAKRSSGRSRSAGSASRAASLRALGALNRQFASLKPRRPASRAASLDASAESKAVTFTCDNGSTVLVTISTQAGALLLQPSGTFNLPAGAQRILWSARGATGANFNVTVTGGTMDAPIRGPLPSGGDGGRRDLTVS